MLASLAKLKIVAKLVGGAAGLLRSWFHPFQEDVTRTSRVSGEVLPVMLAMQNASVFYLGSLGTCVLGNTGMGNIMEVVAMKITKALNQDTSFASFVQLLPPPQSALEEDPSRTAVLVPYTTTALVTSNRDDGVITARSSANAFLQVGAPGQWKEPGPGKPATPWFKSKWRLAFIAVAGAVMSFSLLGTIFIPLIHPAFFAVLSVGILGFILYISFTTTLLLRHALLKAVEQGVMNLDMREAEQLEKERLEREAMNEVKQEVKKNKRKVKRRKGKTSSGSRATSSSGAPSPTPTKAHVTPAVVDPAPGYASDDDFSDS